MVHTCLCSGQPRRRHLQRYRRRPDPRHLVTQLPREAQGVGDSRVEAVVQGIQVILTLGPEDQEEYPTRFGLRRHRGREEKVTRDVTRSFWRSLVATQGIWPRGEVGSKMWSPTCQRWTDVSRELFLRQRRRLQSSCG